MLVIVFLTRYNYVAAYITLRTADNTIIGITAFVKMVRILKIGRHVSQLIRRAVVLAKGVTKR